MPDLDRPDGVTTPKKRRIDTQIPRRKKAKAFSPLVAEWDAGKGQPSTRLRTPQDRMGRPGDR